MPGFTAINDQAPPIRILKTLLTKGTIPHALLFTGIDGIGKRMAALAFAMACNCEGESLPESGSLIDKPVSEPCGSCGPCRKIESGSHPDVIQVVPDGKIIRIAQIRSLCETLSMKPFEARIRVVLLSDAHTLNPEAGNALLKLLEEPPDDTIFILTAPHRSDLLATIDSRCQPVRFRPVLTDSIVRLLTDSMDLTEGEASVVAAMAGGSYAEAIRMQEGGWLRFRKWLTEQLSSIAGMKTASLLAVAEQIAAAPQSLSDGIGIIKTWMRDLLVINHSPGLVVNRDMLPRLESESRRMTDASILTILKMTEAVETRIASNGNARLNMEALFLRIASI